MAGSLYDNYWRCIGQLILIFVIQAEPYIGITPELVYAKPLLQRTPNILQMWTINLAECILGYLSSVEVHPPISRSKKEVQLFRLNCSRAPIIAHLLSRTQC